MSQDTDFVWTGLRAELQVEDWHGAKSVMELVREEQVLIPMQEGSAGSASRMDSHYEEESLGDLPEKIHPLTLRVSL